MPSVLLVVALAAGAQAPVARAPEPARVTFDDAEEEAFLLEAEVVARRAAPGGRSLTTRVTLRRGDLEHDAHVQTHDEYRTQVRLASSTELDFRDTWKNNVAAYRLDRLLGLHMTPVSVPRRDGTTMGAFTWWVDDVLMSERQRFERKRPAPDVEAWNDQARVVRVFDQLIYNFDRNLENLLIDGGWRLWMIDHTRAFKIFGDLRSEEELPDRCDRGLLLAMRRLDRETLENALGDFLSGTQVGGLLERRDRIVRHYDDRIAKRGEAAVLYDLPARPPTVSFSP